MIGLGAYSTEMFFLNHLMEETGGKLGAEYPPRVNLLFYLAFFAVYIQNVLTHGTPTLLSLQRHSLVVGCC